jgi:HlyD family secretion protein
MIRETDSMDTVVEKASGRRKTWLVLGSAVVLLAVAVLLWPAVRRWMSADESVDLARLRVATVVRGDLVRDVSAQGSIVAANHPRLYSPAQGIVALAVRPGQQVRKGQVLLTIESPELESQLAQERARLQSLRSELERTRISAHQSTVTNVQNVELRRVRLEAARRDLVRAEKLRADGLLNEVDHDRSKDAVKIAEVELEQTQKGGGLEREALDFEVTQRGQQVESQQLAVTELERRVRQLTVTSPFDGLVATLDVDDRAAVTPNAPLLTVVDLSAFEIQVQIPEAYADEVGSGTPAVVEYAGREVPAKLTAVSPEVKESQVQGTVAFTGGLPEGLRQNQRVSVRLLLDRKTNVLKVPRGPFLESGGGGKVYVLQDGLATLRDIETGASSVSEVEIVDGLREGEQILLSDIQQFNGAKTVLVRR